MQDLKQPSGGRLWRVAYLLAGSGVAADFPLQERSRQNGIEGPAGELRPAAGGREQERTLLGGRRVGRGCARG